MSQYHKTISLASAPIFPSFMFCLALSKVKTMTNTDRPYEKYVTEFSNEVEFF